MSKLNLGYSLKFEDLYSHNGLSKLDGVFVADLAEKNVELHNKFLNARSNNNELDKKELSNLIIELAPYLEDFLSELFDIKKEVRKLADKHHELANIYSCKRLFVQRQVVKKYKAVDAQNFDGTDLTNKLEELLGARIEEKLYADNVNNWLDDKDQNEDKLDLAAKYASWALFNEEGIKKHKIGILFKLPNKLDFFNLVPVETNIKDGVTVQKLSDSHIRYRDAFSLTDKGASLKEALDNANYCIFCHNQGKDSCSTGLKDKKTEEFKSTIHNVKQAGCPLEEKISEMNLLKSQGVALGALATVTIDNPLCAATGHRICNDCMKSCVYQKQDPVNIPKVETKSLQDILDLPWGFEIYSLLTRWNPLNFTRPLPKDESGYKVLVVGLGPAGFNLTHHLLNEGHTVVAVDGLKIEPVDEKISGVKQNGQRAIFEPIKNIKDIFEDLDERVLAGFGGVAEYGITVRWNKNYLKVIRLLLQRRAHFAMYGGVRFGSTINYDDAFNMGFDHIALAMGAGKPTIIDMPNSLARGVRTASDFLMSLQLTGAAKKDSIANLQLRLPVLVIGGGLTAIDTATESLAYYPRQVEKFLQRHEKLVANIGIDAVTSNWSEEDKIIAEEFISHAKEFRKEKANAIKENRKPDLVSIMKKSGGVKVVYRKKLSDSPAYRLNHEEVELAMQEGIEFISDSSPIGVEIDNFKNASGLKISVKSSDSDDASYSEKILPAKTIFMAVGTNPNTVLAREDNKNFKLNGKYFQAINEEGQYVDPEPNTSKPSEVNILLNKSENNKYTSFIGDLHPSYVGNVVKAMGAAKQTYPIISKILEKSEPNTKLSSADFISKMNEELIATIYDVVRLTDNIIEVIVKAPAAARKFEPGQFYRLQNFEANALKTIDGSTKLAMEGLALTGAWVDKEKGLLSTIVLEMGGSSDLCAYLKKDEPIILMGPTGTPTHISKNENVMLVGGGLGNAVLFSIGKAFKDAGSKVLYFAGYKKAKDRYKIEEIKKAADKIIWACDDATFEADRAQDASFQGNIVQAIEAYARGDLGNCDIKLEDIDRIIVIGSDRMMWAVTEARKTVLKDYLNPNHIAIGSINSPMQCMMKEICAQCLQKHVDPISGEEKYVYSCYNQDQELDYVSFAHLNERLKQNSVQEKLTAKWIDHCLRELNLREIAA